MIVTVVRAADFDRFVETFSTRGVEKRREHGCKGAHLFRDPEDPDRIWVFFDWKEEDYQGFLADPEIPDIARELALQEPPVRVDPVASYDS
ncbi:antibiotic biosynthesis monooxygenase [Actinophytocola gossypii]|uniref:Antibiotic biosynthesis monooxygenase n=1 Tax=Actinophytocola gossypii TaxID=2812003 RepID=A0ABT2JDU6_9PSEU|nr:antibiotic biosynthesis monooxygenase [Actinophytocola gossypii]MCT2586049.1 antibiotic biosynthesis monooxygenase [Actinophytocola gossypii]